jgi:predicted Zn-dependent protease
LWTRAIGHVQAGDVPKAIEAILEMKKKYDFRPHDWAYLGQAYILNGDSKNARNCFVTARNSTTLRRNSYERYINMFSEILIETIDTQAIPHEKITAARKIPARRHLRRWLPLSNDDLAPRKAIAE